jgi:hypothetical protein
MRYFKGVLYIFLHTNKCSIKKVFTFFLFTAIFISTHTLAYSFQLALAWDPNTDPDIAGYKIYYGKISRNYTFEVDVGKYESVTISGLVPGKTYYFAVTAYDLSGNESDFSDEISYSGSAQKSMPWIPLLLLDD